MTDREPSPVQLPDLDGAGITSLLDERLHRARAVRYDQRARVKKAKAEVKRAHAELDHATRERDTAEADYVLLIDRQKWETQIAAVGGTAKN
ncbi:hypothetical protein BJD99_01025 [Rhodococcus sp. 1163]|uniref:hypothetical protein n=1 Tax=Rhodococcus sp. 1163 TaxID=1905289 RepID=UPI000A047AEB|nr:hypothetical protein [Rhodococcus sp. 1163]ORI11754.1 hypothetical protein BJD99_01025 [Rhodococcus sp. 1163]